VAESLIGACRGPSRPAMSSVRGESSEPTGSVGFGVVTQVPDSRFTGVTRVATARDVPVVADCLASAFFEDPLTWGLLALGALAVRARTMDPA